MKWVYCIATVGTLALTSTGHAQGSKKEPAKGDVTKATYLVGGVH